MSAMHDGDDDPVFDEDNPEWTEEDVARARPISELPWLASAFPNTRVALDAAEVLRFWLEECSPEQHFAKDAALDAEIGRRFGEMRERVLETGAAAWRDQPETLVAAVILLDQFSRNIHRGTARAFEGDALALALAREAIAAGWDRTMPDGHRYFLCMPFMHAEDATAQADSVRLFEALGDAKAIPFAHDHAEVIARFGRFPSRNAALGRESTPDECDYLSQPDAGW